VTEDEAFIRAIVDSPGDDTPRLVYADWLDDHDDPCGSYLRAEHETVEAGDIGGLRALRLTAINVARLDPVWLARVSRPPVGVCCDHVRFAVPGPVLSPTDIDQVEQRLGGVFSADFRGFLLNYNGGKPTPACLPYPNRAGAAWADMDLEIGKFNRASRPGELPAEGNDPWGFEIEGERAFLEELYETGGGEGPNPLIADMAPFADTIHDLGSLLIGIGETNRGRVYHFRDYCHFSNDPGHLFDYATTFAEFLFCLRSDRVS
jgi:uncharacterized protein (TIGR02996 family)